MSLINELIHHMIYNVQPTSNMAQTPISYQQYSKLEFETRLELLLFCLIWEDKYDIILNMLLQLNLDKISFEV